LMELFNFCLLHHEENSVENFNLHLNARELKSNAHMLNPESLP
jgi:hypothetical protein